MNRILPLLLLLLCPLFGSCTVFGIGGDDIDVERIRWEVHQLRVELEPILDTYIYAKDDPGLAADYVKVKAFADAAATAWDAYLEDRSDEKVADLIAALNAGLDAADLLVPHLVGADNPDRALAIRTTIAVIRIAVARVAHYLDEPELAAEAEAAATPAPER